jgi:putative ABC transport system substrate-binding protein
VAILGDSTTPGNTQLLKETRLAGAALGVRLQYIEVHDPKDIDTAFREAGRQRAGAVLVLPNSATTAHRKEVAELALKGRLPAIYYPPEFVEAGGLMSYGVSITDLFRRAADYVLARGRPLHAPRGRSVRGLRGGAGGELAAAAAEALLAQLRFR